MCYTLTSLSSHPSGRSSLSLSDSDVEEGGGALLEEIDERGGADGVADAAAVDVVGSERVRESKPMAASVTEVTGREWGRGGGGSE